MPFVKKVKCQFEIYLKNHKVQCGHAEITLLTAGIEKAGILQLKIPTQSSLFILCM